MEFGATSLEETIAPRAEGFLVRLVETRDIAPEVRHFLFEVSGVRRFQFAAGQFVSFTEPLGGKPVTRAYSIASPPDGNRFELCLNRVKEGVFSPWLFELRPGDALRAKGPYGAFVVRRPHSEALFVATGTGIAPIRSMLLDRLASGAAQPLTLLFGVRRQDSILYGEEFMRLARDHANFRFWPTLTRPGPEWPGRAGRVQLHLEEAVGGGRDLDVYVCGLKEMVDDVRARLRAMGFDRRHIIYEKYD